MRPWECPRCRKINAPWLNQCFCQPTQPQVPETLPPTKPAPAVEVTSTGSWVLRMDDP